MLQKTTLSLTLALAAALACLPASASDAAKPPAAKPAATKPAAKAPAKKPAAPAAAAAATAAAVALTPGQLDAAQRVFTGKADCEFGEKIDVAAIDGKPGHFHLKHKTATYTLVPEETTTGAVRLEDKRAGIVWLQIPAKSMLMNAKIGQRVADNCLMQQQKS
jgi:hypothetical protein